MDHTQQPYHRTLSSLALKAWRHHLGISQQALAERSGVSGKTICFIERRGELARPGTRRKLAVALGIEPHHLVGPPATMERKSQK